MVVMAGTWADWDGDPMVTGNYLGKLQYFTHLKSWAIKGDDSPNPNHHLWVSVAT